MDSGECTEKSAGEEWIGVAYTDPWGAFVVVEKPSGLLSVPGKGFAVDVRKADCVIRRVRLRYPQAAGPMVVHRLDMETSGLMVVALDPVSQRELSVAFQERRVEKAYEAVVEVGEGLRGVGVGEGGELDVPMRVDVGDRPRQAVDVFHGKESRTRFRVLERWEEAGVGERARLRLEPVTGRSHQLRVHCAAGVEVGGLGSPIVGDVLYGVGVSVGKEGGEVERVAWPEDVEGWRADGRLRLHAGWLRFAWQAGWVEVSSAAPF